MKQMSEGAARIFASREQRAAESGGLSPRTYVIIVHPRRGKPYGAECTEAEFRAVSAESRLVEILMQPRRLKRAGEKSFVNDWRAPRSRSARTTLLAAQEE